MPHGPRRCRHALVPVLLLALAWPGAGCAHLGLDGGEKDAQALRARAEEAVRREDWEAAYGHLRTLRARHPARPETAEAFPLAAVLYRKLYYRDRYRAPDPVWLTSEPDFVFDWLASLHDGDAFPGDAVRALLVGMPFPFAQRYAAWAAQHPATARWELEVVEDNGIVESVTGRPAEATAR